MEGCAAPPILPDKPFFVVWNHPSGRCEHSGVHIPFSDYGIVDNNKDVFIGEKIALIYEYFGSWPYIDKKGDMVNGGIPQLADLDKHFAKVKSDIDKLIPNKSFSGLGVIDFEYWRPLWETNFTSLRKYQRATYDLLKKQHPTWTQKQIEAAAVKNWNEAARKIMYKTLQMATELRPNGKWGYYLYPRPWSSEKLTIKRNDEMNWIFNTSTGLYPSIYFNPKTGSASSHQEMVKAYLKETLRVKAKWSQQDAPILPYTLSQEGPWILFNDSDLSIAIGQPANMGASGVVIWGASADLHRPGACVVLKNHVEKTLGPYVLKLTNFFGNCTKELCSSNGRCVRKDYERVYQKHLKESGRTNCRIPEIDLAMGKTNKNVLLQTLRQATETTRNQSDRKLNGNTLIFNSNFDVGLWTWWSNISKRQGMMSVDGADYPERENTTVLHRENTSNVRYDFDDYVCKCFVGWTGKRCNKKI